ncbi:MAG: c-type cytochrome [Gammaproteobacteria bacterium]
MKRLPALGLLWLFSMTVFAGEPSPDRQEELRNLLKQDCGACHGLTLKGGMGPPLLPEALAGKSDEFLAETILNGRQGTAMPPWQTFLTRDEAFWLVGVLRGNVR